MRRGEGGAGWLLVTRHAAIALMHRCIALPVYPTASMAGARPLLPPPHPPPRPPRKRRCVCVGRYACTGGQAFPVRTIRLARSRLSWLSLPRPRVSLPSSALQIGGPPSSIWGQDKMLTGSTVLETVNEEGAHEGHEG